MTGNQNISIHGGATAETLIVGNNATINVTHASPTYQMASNNENISDLMAMLIKKSETTEFHSKVIDACEAINKERLEARGPNPSMIEMALKKLSEIAPAIAGAASIVESIQRIIK